MPFVCHDDDGVFVIHSSGVIRLDDVEALAAEEDAYLARPGCKGLLLCDCSELKVISPEGADALVARMRAVNQRIVRSAFIVSEGTAALQLKRMIRDAAGSHRVVFATATQARAWLLASPH